METPELLDDDLVGRRKLEAVSTYMTPELKAILEQWAEEESRSLSRHVLHLLTQAAKEYQQAKDKEGKA